MSKATVPVKRLTKAEAWVAADRNRRGSHPPAYHRPFAPGPAPHPVSGDITFAASTPFRPALCVTDAGGLVIEQHTFPPDEVSAVIRWLREVYE